MRSRKPWCFSHPTVTSIVDHNPSAPELDLVASDLPGGLPRAPIGTCRKMTKTELRVALAHATQTDKETAGVFLDTLGTLAYKEIKKNGEFVNARLRHPTRHLGQY